MEQTFTSDHLIRFLYKETSASESLAIDAAIHEDADLWEEYRALREAYHQLPKVTFRPSKNAIQQILKYSAHKAVELK